MRLARSRFALCRGVGMVTRINEMRKRRGDNGFTLIELLVVIIILGILSAVVVFAVTGINNRGEEAADEIDERTVRSAEEAYYAKNGFYATEDELVAAGFLSEKSTYNDVALIGSPDPRSKYEIVEAPTATVSVAANADQWITSDTGSGPGYNSSAFAYPLNSNLYDPLIIIGSDYTLQPGLATSWELIPVGDPRKPTRPYNFPTWRFHLRQGVTFHDGSTFDADDVIWTWRDRAPLNQSPLSTVTNTLGFSKPYYGTFPSAPLAGGNPDSVEKIDQFTVDFTPKQPNLRLAEQIGHPKGAIVPEGKHFDGSTGGSPLGGPALTPGQPIGSGPFRYVGYNPTSPQGGGNASFEANDSYWGARAQVKRMNYTFIGDAAQRTSALLSGQADVAIDLNALDVDTVDNSGQGHAVHAAYGRNLLIYVNRIVKYGPGDEPKYDLGQNPAIRKAVSLAINRTDHVNAIYEGNAAVGRWMAPPNILGSSQAIVPELVQDQALARSTLANDGWVCTGAAAPDCAPNEIRQKAGRVLQLKLIGGPDAPIEEYTLLQNEMKAVGIDLQFIRYATNDDRRIAYGTTLWDLDLEPPNQNDADPAFLPVLRFACKNQSATFRFAPVDGTNGIGASSPDGTNGRYPFGRTPCTSPGAVLGPFDTQWVTGASGSDNATTQTAVQQAAANQMRILVGQNETNVVIPVVGLKRIYGLRNNVNLGDPHPSQTSQRWVSLTKT